jgi:TetR/AcrR family transcriptional regulator
MKKPGANSDRTRKLILKHATDEFATKGYDGARVDSIARRFGLSKNMLYHYFGSKEDLFIAVLENSYKAFRARQQYIGTPHADPVEAISRLIAQTFSAFTENHKLVALLTSENLHKGRHIRRSRAIRPLYNPLIDRIREILHQGAVAGVFRKNLDPVLIYVSFSALAYHYVSNRFTLNAALGVDFSTRKSRDAWLAHIIDLTLTYCCVPPSEICRQPHPARRSRSRSRTCPASAQL